MISNPKFFILFITNELELYEGIIPLQKLLLSQLKLGVQSITKRLEIQLYNNKEKFVFL